MRRDKGLWGTGEGCGGLQKATGATEACGGGEGGVREAYGTILSCGKVLEYMGL